MFIKNFGYGNKYPFYKVIIMCFYLTCNLSNSFAPNAKLNRKK